jgi:hypothetical protein
MTLQLREFFTVFILIICGQCCVPLYKQPGMSLPTADRPEEPAVQRAKTATKKRFRFAHCMHSKMHSTGPARPPLWPLKFFSPILPGIVTPTSALILSLRTYLNLFLLWRRVVVVLFLG